MRWFEPSLAYVRRVGLAILLAVVFMGVAASSAQAEWRPRHKLHRWVNEVRANNVSLAPWGSKLNTVARSHSLTMRNQRRVFHSSFEPCWYRGENVGAVTTSRPKPLRHLFEAFMDSAPHRANIVNPYFTRVGIGAAVGGGVVYVTMMFCR